jgi:DNA-binding MarR family transcriptional regulator
LDRARVFGGVNALESSSMTQLAGEDHSLVDAVMSASSALDGLTARSLAAVNEEVTVVQYRTLTVLATRGPQTVHRLAEHMGVHASTMTRMYKRLVKRKLVRTASTADGREVMIALSNSGSALVKKVTAVRSRVIGGAIRRLDPSERATAERVLHDLAIAAGRERANA